MVTAIHEQIKTLVDLQKIDAEIYQLRKELAAHPLLIQTVEGNFEKKKANLKKAEEESKGLQLKQREREAELEAKEEKIKKLQAQLYQLKSNREYAAMELEIKGMKADKSVLEEDILKLFDSVEQARAQAAREKEALASEEKEAQTEINRIKQRSSEITAAITTLESQRKIFLPLVEARLLSQYERVLKSKEGLALVPVKNNSCGGCHLELPPQTVNEIQLQDKLIVCESCARILYWPS